MRGGVDSRRRWILVGALGAALLPEFVFAQGQRGYRKETVRSTCTGAPIARSASSKERKQSAKVVVYTSLNLKDSVPIVEVFEKKYGG